MLQMNSLLGKIKKQMQKFSQNFHQKCSKLILVYKLNEDYK